MNVVLHIPDDFAEQLSVGEDVERRALEALALESYRAGRLTKAELRRLLDIRSPYELDGFLKAHDVYEPDTVKDVEREVAVLSELASDDADRMRARQAAENIIARRKGVTLGGLTIGDLINEGRP